MLQPLTQRRQRPFYIGMFLFAGELWAYDRVCIMCRAISAFSGCGIPYPIHTNQLEATVLFSVYLTVLEDKSEEEQFIDAYNTYKRLVYHTAYKEVSLC